MKTSVILISMDDGEYTTVIPLIDNNVFNQEEMDNFQEELSKELCFEYHTIECSLDMVDITNPDDTVRCEETNIWLFKEKAIIQDLYARPHDNIPDTYYFLNELARDGYMGEIYSKDFSYFYCEGCNRYICQQNPSNGWMIQYTWLGDDDSEMVCNRCYEEHSLENGMDIEKCLRTRTIPGLFMNGRELEEAGWKTVLGFEDYLLGMGRSGSSGDYELNKLLDAIEDIDNNNGKMFIEYNDMAIGGLGGYITLWMKGGAK